MLSLALLFVLLCVFSVLFSILVSPLGEERELVNVPLVHLFVYLHALIFVFCLFLLVSGGGCGL